jgi:hypothetical protein
MQSAPIRLLLGLLTLSLACSPSDPGTTEGAGSTTGSTGGVVIPTTGFGSSGEGSTTSETTTTTTGEPMTTTSVSTTTGDGILCGGKIYACQDGMDNDMDGKVDLEDPECTGPCDDAEDSFQTGIPGDNVDCKQDCFFDGNSGQGEGCTWDLKCDPANPGEFINCAYDENKSCPPVMQSDECKMICEAYVPNGCDCFGCCSVLTPNGEVNIFLNSSPECSLLNLEACTECTPQIEDCGNDCNPDDCELCFGEDTLPPGCDVPGGCEDWQIPCMDAAPCVAEYGMGAYCVTGCCAPPPQG